jgi:hypothetical protein
MPAGDPNFCDHYQADQNVQAWINDPSSAPADFVDFFQRYDRWIKEGRRRGLKNMLPVFEDFDDSERALNAGDTQDHKENGRVLSDDCGAFNEFVSEKYKFSYSPEEIASLLEFYPLLKDDDIIDAAFAAGLKKYFVGDFDMLTPLEEAALNGALFVQVDLSSSPFAAPGSDRRLFAIPGRVFFHKYGRPLDGLWRLVDDRLKDAFEKAGSRRINVTGAAQLRLGIEDELFGPVNVGTGFTIKGRV